MFFGNRSLRLLSKCGSARTLLVLFHWYSVEVARSNVALIPCPSLKC